MQGQYRLGDRVFYQFCDVPYCDCMRQDVECMQTGTVTMVKGKYMAVTFDTEEALARTLYFLMLQAHRHVRLCPSSTVKV